MIGQGRGAPTRRWKHVCTAAFPSKEVFGPVWWPVEGSVHVCVKLFQLPLHCGPSRSFGLLENPWGVGSSVRLPGSQILALRSGPVRGAQGLRQLCPRNVLQLPLRVSDPATRCPPPLADQDSERCRQHPTSFH